jgi:hypothetical protein
LNLTFAVEKFLFAPFRCHFAHVRCIRGSTPYRRRKNPGHFGSCRLTVRSLQYVVVAQFSFHIWSRQKERQNVVSFQDLHVALPSSRHMVTCQIMTFCHFVIRRMHHHTNPFHVSYLFESPQF